MSDKSTIEQLYELAAVEYPTDGTTCPYKIKKALWQRDKWVKDYLTSIVSDKEVTSSLSVSE